MLLLQGRCELPVVPAFIAFLYITVLWIRGLAVILLVNGRG